MEIKTVFDDDFRKYGRIIDGLDTSELIAEMGKIAHPENGVEYLPAIDSLEKCSVYDILAKSVYGMMPIQIGMCWGHNTKLNCLEYHRDSEINIGESDFVLLLASMDDIEDGKLDTSKVKAFRAPKGVAVEVYATSLHYAPCQIDQSGFRVAIVLPKGTNYPLSAFSPCLKEDSLLRAVNKWLIAHPESAEASDGAYIGLTGCNIDISR